VREDGMIVLWNGEQEVPYFYAEEIFLPGKHNLENYLTAIALTDGAVSVASTLEVAKHFQGVAHRLEFVREVGGVAYYNSSIDTSPTRTLAALASFEEKLIVIVGGYDKHIPIEPLIAPLSEKAKFVVATGDTGLSVLSALAAYGYAKKDMAYLGDFDSAVRYAADIAKEGDTVILSPAAASFDAFKNFEERGNRFRKLVEML
jgi:UDP-N-acetylmuramoylalanine--D-glutamate ligase